MTKFNAAFWKWFGDSKVVDSKGNPLVVYHGTNSDFIKKKNASFDLSKCEIGCHFGTKKQATRAAMSEDCIFRFYLSIQNPLRLVDVTVWNIYEIAEQAPQLFDGMKINEDDDSVARKALYRHGYDGIVYLNRHEGINVDDYAGSGEIDLISDKEFKKYFPSARDSWIALYPQQIKLAENDGTWDIDDPDIRSNPPVVWTGNTGRIGDQGKIIISKAGSDDLADYFPELYGKNVYIIEDIYVNERYRGGMTAAILFRAAISKIGNHPIIAQAYPYMEETYSKAWKKRQNELIRIYEQFGFEHVGDGWMVKT